MLVQMVLFDGFDPLDVIAPYEVLYAGGELTGGALAVELVSAEGPRQVPSGIKPLSLSATARLDPERADLVVVPGAVAGLIEGRPATTHHMGMDVLEATGAVAVDARIVDDRDLVSGASVTSGLDLGLYLLERELGPRVAHAVEKLFAHERSGTVWRNAGRAVEGSRHAR